MCSNVPVRYVLLFLLFVGYFTVPLLRLNISIAIVSMVNSSSVDNTNQSQSTYAFCSDSESDVSTDNGKSGTLDWNPVEQGLALGCYFYGFVASAILGAWAARRFGFKIVLGGAMFIASTLTIMQPFAAKGGLVYFVIVRIIIGFSQGVVSPSSIASFPVWVPVQHRTATYSRVLSGFFIGSFASLPLSAVISKYIGWEAVFYVTGSFALFWSILFFWLVHESPEKHPRITEREKKFLLENTNPKSTEKGKEEQRIPWLRIMTSLPFLATILSHVSLEWTLTMSSLVLPTYFTRMLNLGIVAAGAAAGSPFLVMMIFSLVGERVSNKLKARKKFSLTVIRKGMISMATVPSAICFILVSFTGCNQNLAITLFFLIVSFQGLHIPSTEANVFALSERFCSILFAILITTSQLSGFVVPQLTGVLLYNNNSMEGWRTIFLITAGVNLLAAIIFCIFGSSEEQPWSKQETDSKVDEEVQTPLPELQNTSTNIMTDQSEL